MNSIDEFVLATDKMLEEEKRKLEAAENEKALYSELREVAAENEKAARATMKELELAKLHAERAQASRVDSDQVTTRSTVYTSNDDEVVYVDNETKKTNKRKGIFGTILIGAAAIILVTGCWKFMKQSKTGDVRLAATNTKSNTEDTNSDARTNVVDNGDVNYNYENNEVVVNDSAKTDAPRAVANTESQEAPAAPSQTAPSQTAPSQAPVAQEPLTNERFEELVANYANKYSLPYNSVSTADIAKFAVITNIDILSEQNPELVATIADGQTKEEFLNDAAKVIGATVMHNFKVWNETHSTEGFIKVSDIVYGEQREQMLKIEGYVDRIADAVNQGDADLVNEIVSEFLEDMNSGELSKLDDGVGFAAQTSIATIADGIARNYLNKENFDMFQILKTSEKYVSNIFTEYDKCNGSGYTLTRK